MEELQDVTPEAPSTSEERINDVAASSTEKAETPAPVGDDALPFGKHPRWQEVLSERNAAKEAATKHETDLKALQSYVYNNRQGIDWWNSLQTDQQKRDAVIAVLTGQQPAQKEAPKDTIGEQGYDPFITQQLKNAQLTAEKLADIEAALKQQEEKTKWADYERQKIENNAKLDTFFEKRCSDLKITSEEDKQALALMSAHIARTMIPKDQDVAFAPQEVLQESLKQAYAIIDSIKKGARTALGTMPIVPASGSSTGMATRQEYASNAQERIADIMNSMGG